MGVVIIPIVHLPLEVVIIPIVLDLNLMEVVGFTIVVRRMVVRLPCRQEFRGREHLRCLRHRTRVSRLRSANKCHRRRLLLLLLDRHNMRILVTDRPRQRFTNPKQDLAGILCVPTAFIPRRRTSPCSKSTVILPPMEPFRPFHLLHRLVGVRTLEQEDLVRCSRRPGA